MVAMDVVVRAPFFLSGEMAASTSYPFVHCTPPLRIKTKERYAMIYYAELKRFFYC